MNSDSSQSEDLLQEAQKTAEGPVDFSALNLSSLAHLCRQATNSYFQRVSYDDRACMELFRRAIQEQEERAWQILVEQYGNLVKSWIHRHQSFSLADENHDYFLNRAFDNFWHTFSLNPQKFSKFPNLRSLLQYLKLCAYTAVQQYVERQMGPQHNALSDTPVELIAGTADPIGSIDNQMLAGAVWEYVISSVHSEEERIVAEDYFLLGMKPKEIFDRHRGLFRDPGHVSRVKGNLVARLRRDKQLFAIVDGSE